MVENAARNDEQLAAVAMWDEKADRPHFVRDLYEMCGYVVKERADGLTLAEAGDVEDYGTEAQGTDVISLADWANRANALAEQHSG